MYRLMWQMPNQPKPWVFTEVIKFVTIEDNLRGSMLSFQRDTQGKWNASPPTGPLARFQADLCQDSQFPDFEIGRLASSGPDSESVLLILDPSRPSCPSCCAWGLSFVGRDAVHMVGNELQDSFAKSLVSISWFVFVKEPWRFVS